MKIINLLSMRRLAPGVVLATMAGLVVGLTLATPAAHADSGRKCAFPQGPNEGQVCLSTFDRDSTHIDGANVDYYRLSPGCVSARFYHFIVRSSDGFILGSWGDHGAFTICAGEYRSFAWHHGGSGAYVPPGAYVQGQVFINGNVAIFSPKIFQGRL